MGIKAIRGTKDILPVDSPAWRRVEESSRIVCKRFGYHEIRTPVMEETALFGMTIGEDTDIVKKEMFSFLDRGERNISLTNICRLAKALGVTLSELMDFQKVNPKGRS